MAKSYWIDRRIGAQMARNSATQTPDAIAWTFAHARACVQTNVERTAQFPTITPDNFGAVNAWQNVRIDELTKLYLPDELAKLVTKRGRRR